MEGSKTNQQQKEQIKFSCHRCDYFEIVDKDEWEKLPKMKMKLFGDIEVDMLNNFGYMDLIFPANIRNAYQIKAQNGGRKPMFCRKCVEDLIDWWIVKGKTIKRMNRL